jgi:uncharacterized membrane-anchored protein YjiN (DUF445 family)
MIDKNELDTNLTWNDFTYLYQKHCGWKEAPENQDVCDECYRQLKQQMQKESDKKLVQRIKELEAEYAKKLEDFKASFVPRRNISQLLS